ncbi:MAG: gamma-glutamylcyclotransferase [Deltaproteobacteria bacterium]|nr:gamma-glutamylcyclotransferase [Deltaproteobacteria bacterium]MBW2360069.1 gamma-glutamylcyclotransferase [Deltaproteobacteria bacterium]
MQALYFAYGSNLSSARMRQRVPSAVTAGTARLAGYRLTTDKAGRDGTGKANLRRVAGESVWGIVWRLDIATWPTLDACERGYERIQITLEGAVVSAQTYLSQRLTDDPVLAADYKRFLVEGAREHRLPPDWISQLEALPTR